MGLHKDAPRMVTYYIT